MSASTFPGSPTGLSLASSMTPTPREPLSPRATTAASSRPVPRGFSSSSYSQSRLPGEPLSPEQENLLLASQVQAILADFAAFRATSTEQHELLLNEAAHWKELAENLRLDYEELQERAHTADDWQQRAERAELECDRLRDMLDRAELDRDELSGELQQERERSNRLLSSVAHMDRTVARLRESNTRYERENRVLLQSLTTASEPRPEPLPITRPVSRASPKETARPLPPRESPERRDRTTSSSARPTDPYKSLPPPLPTSSTTPQPPSHPRKRSPSPSPWRSGTNPITGAAASSPAAGLPGSPASTADNTPIGRKHSQRIRESRSSIFGASAEPEQASPAQTTTKSGGTKEEDMDKKEIAEKVDYWNAQKSLLESQYQKPGPRAKKEALASQLEEADKELGHWKMRLRLYGKKRVEA